ncbi:PREDICTED: complement C1s subcomponent-like [Gekko japonicus]|uniref:Complement C1s subcomponent-like n=1 Tax=Gekko japonicus TaxID=146911 RepID=A0ABM1L8F4_GEKJA|nr:PREDICTED: complement C1s subcomponent-like [Gekko japonicus]
MELFHMGSFITCFLFTCSDAAPMFGEILSPNYPQAYPNDTLESWEINVPPGYGIRLYFTHLDIEPSQNCEYDSVKILTGDHLEGQLCGRKKSHTPASHILKEFYVPDNTLRVTFQSDFSNEELFTGFAAYYVAVDVNECTEFVEKVCSHYCNNYIGGYFCTCPPPYILYEDQKTCGVNCSGDVFTEPTGEITSPNYPSPYSENLHCVYRVVLEPGYSVVLAIEKKGFDTEPADSEGNCSNALTVSAGDRRFGPFCGNTFTGPSQIKVQSSSLKIDFRTNKYTQGKGWKIRYFGDPITCPQNVSENSVLDPKRERYVFKDSVKVTCIEGYVIVTPQSSFTSFNSSCESNGEWRGSHLKCEPAECGVPDDVENADVRYLTGPGQTQYQAEIYYDCHTYYALKKNGSGIHRCSATGQWVDENEKAELPVCIPACGVPRNPIQNTGRIFGGTRAEHGNFPWQILFANPRAGGALISDRWVLTAAHVLDENWNPTMYAGLLTVGPQTMQTAKPLVVDEVFVHPGWKEAPGESRTDFDNDIALVRLKKPVKMGPTISTICLPSASPEYDPPERTLGYITGWGRTEDRSRSVILRKAWIPVANMEQCRRAKPESPLDLSAYRFTDNMICAGDGHGDSCSGDAGGAYAIVDPHKETRYYVAGLVSWGAKCGTYGLYTKVANYVEWIAEVMSRQPAEEEDE